MALTSEGLIIRENDKIGESDRFIVALTREQGVLRASVRGARKINSRNGAGTSLLTYSRLTLTEGKNKWIVTDAHPLRVFFGLRSDVTRLALAQYFCELASVLAPRGEPAPDTLRLLLNALHLLEKGERDPQLLKLTVEQGLLREAGYAPDLSACRACGKADGAMVLFPEEGRLLCQGCAGPMPAGYPLTAGAVSAWRYLLTEPVDKLFSFRLSPEAQSLLAEASERFLLICLGRGFATLDFYHSMA